MRSPSTSRGARNRTSSSSTLWLRGRAPCGSATSSCSRRRWRREGSVRRLPPNSGGPGLYRILDLTFVEFVTAKFAECTFFAARDIREAFVLPPADDGSARGLAQGCSLEKRTSEAPLPSTALKISSDRFVFGELYRDSLLHKNGVACTIIGGARACLTACSRPSPV